MKFLNALLRLSAHVTENGLLMADSAMRSIQQNLGKLSGTEAPAPPTRPPMEGPADLDSATSDFSNRAFRILQSARFESGSVVETSRELFNAAMKSYSYEKNFRDWMLFPLQLPLSFGTLATQQGLRTLYAARSLSPDRVPGFLAYVTEIFSDLHVYLSLQYKERLEKLTQRVSERPDDHNARLDLGRCLIKCGRYTEAAFELSIAARDPGLRRRALYEATVANCRAGNYREAVEAGTAAVLMDPLNERAQYWLWLATRKAGGYPADFPQEFRMELKAGQHPSTVQFEDVARAIGLDKTAGGRGTAVFDYDGDGYLDVVVASAHGGCSLYHNNGDGTFTDVSVGSGLDACVNVFGIIAGDYNNDGVPDLYITRLGFFGGECELLRNNGDGTFTNVTRQAGLECWGPAFSAAWVDYDCDGHLDLFVANNLGGLFDRKNPNRLFHNNGNGTFTEVADQAGLKTLYPTIGCAWGDYDNDGFPDLFVSNGIAPAQLYRNNGDGTFTDVSHPAGFDDPCIGSVACWCDYDNDGWLDLVQFVWSPPEDTIYTLRTGHGPKNAFPLRIYHNNRDGTFTCRTKDLGVDGCWGTMSASVGDFNNDGYLDLFLGNGDPQMDRTEPPIILENDGNGRFNNVTFAAGLPFTGKGHGANMADLAGDGRLHLIIASGGLYPGDLLTVAVFRPKTVPGNYLNVRLAGTRSNRDAIGARLELRAGGRAQYRSVSGGTGFGCLPYEQHFGLADFTRVDSLHIRWPSGLEQELSDLPINTTIRITEGSARWELVYPAERTVSNQGIPAAEALTQNSSNTTPEVPS